MKMASKRKQDEKHLKMLREMVALPHNKQCFDCHQRGPTYVNMTIGSYVCTACSGILRGINPPHRVKSISMASFTPEEIEFIKCHGNDFCRKVWLGLFDSRTSTEPDSRDEQKVKDFMAQKYERKRWYVAPTDAMKEEAKQLNEAATNKQPATRPLKSLLGEHAPKLVVQNNQSPQPVQKNPAVSQTQPAAAPASQAVTFPSPSSQSSQSSGSVTMDLLGDLGGDPFTSSASSASTPAKAPVVSSGGEGGFADFANFNQFSAPASSQSFPAFQTTNNPLVPLGGPSSAPAPKPVANGGFGSGTSVAPPTSAAQTAPLGGDRYSALSDLFSDSAPATSQSAGINWSGGGGGGGGSGTGISWGGDSSGGTGINWGGGSSSSGTGGTGITWNSSGTTNTSDGGINWNSTGPASTSTGGVSWNSTVNSNTELSASGSMSNPFGGAQTALSTQSTMGGGVSNPFGGGGGNQGMFGGPGGFGQPGMGQQMPGFGQPTVTSGGFGQPAVSSGGFGQPAVSSGGFGQPAVSTGGFGQPAASAGFGFGQGGFGGAPAPSLQSGGQFGQFAMQNGGAGFNQMGSVSSAGGFPQTMPSNVGGAMNTSSGQFNKLGGAQSMQGFPAGWGQNPQQQPAANPFMSAASQPMATKTGSTNPFL